MCKGSHFIRHKEEGARFFSISYTKRKIATLLEQQSLNYNITLITNYKSLLRACFCQCFGSQASRYTYLNSVPTSGMSHKPC